MPKLRLYAAGSNSHGQLGINSLEDAHTFTPCNIELPVLTGRLNLRLAAGANHTLLLIRDEASTHLYGAGSSRLGQLCGSREDLALSFTKIRLPNIDIEDIVDIGAGWESSYIAEQKRLFCLGRPPAPIHADGDINEVQLALEATDSISSIAAGPSHFVATTKGGKAYGCGTSRHGQLGQSTTPAGSDLAASPVDVGPAEAVSCAAVGMQHTVLGLSPTVESSTKGIGVLLLGNNRKGQLGCEHAKRSSYTLSMPEAERVRVHAAWNTTYIETPDRILSFGSNAHGQLGRDSSGETLGAIGSVQLPAEHHLIQLAAGSEHVLALLVTPAGGREVWGWGWNEHGNLGSQDGDLSDVRLPKSIWLTDNADERLHSVHAGNGTSWIATLCDDG